jgi:hypothetical protein
VASSDELGDQRDGRRRLVRTERHPEPAAELAEVGHRRPGDRCTERGAEDQDERRQQDDGQGAGALQQHHRDQ